MINPKPKNFMLAAAPLFLVLFIDSMGLGLVFPILNTLVFDSQAQFFSAVVSLNLRHLLYGFTISIYMFTWFFGAAFLGDLSDQIGRKKSLMICLIGAMIGYFLSAWAVAMTSYSLLLLGRVIAGFTAGSQSIAQAAIVDISHPSQKARNIGLILFFTSLGFVFGPVVGGILSAHSLVSWFNYQLPFYFAAMISLLNAFLLQFVFKESFTHTHKIRFKWHHALEIFVSAFTHKKIRNLSIVFLIMILGWSGFYTFISVYLYSIYHFTALQNGFYMGLMGVGFGISTGFLVGPLTKRFTLKQSIIVGSLLAAVGTLWTVLAPSELHVWLAVILVSVAVAFAYSTIIALFSNQVNQDAQGWVMGICGAIMAFAFGVTGLLIGIIANVSPQLPLIMTATLLVLTAVLMTFLYQDEAETVKIPDYKNDED